MSNREKVRVIGAGLAGCEAAYYLAQHGIEVELYEMKPHHFSPAHKYSGFAELVCSNSLKAKRLGSAAGLLKHEMRLFGSLILKSAEENAVDAGGALAVDRQAFSNGVTEAIRGHKNIRVIEGQVDAIPDEGYVVVATGPLTTGALAENISSFCGSSYLSFYDAAAPIVSFESLNQAKVFFASRYGRGDDDYINCPFTKEEYEAFYEALLAGERVELKEFEQHAFKVYEGCMPIEVMAQRGADTMRFGPLKPVGLTDPKTGRRPWAVLQLRKENKEGSLYNMVGFQTNLKFGEQKRIFSMIPGLENAEFVRYGVMHRNTFLDSPRLLDSRFCLKREPRIYFAGQISGVEGYMESAASGLAVAYHLTRRLQGKPPIELPKNTMMGALSHYISDESVMNFQPMGCNMGLLPSPAERIKDKTKRYEKVAAQALQVMEGFLQQQPV